MGEPPLQCTCKTADFAAPDPGVHRIAMSVAAVLVTQELDYS